MEKRTLVPIHVRIEAEQYEWLRRYTFDNRLNQAEVVREALELYRSRSIKEGNPSLEKSKKEDEK